MDVEFAPRLNYARLRPELNATPDVVVDREDGRFVLTGLRSPTLTDATARDSIRIAKDDTHWFVLEYGSTRPTDGIKYGRVLEETIRYWREWVDTNAYRPGGIFDGRWRDLVIRSSLVLKLLTYEETGAVCAAPTTSLPELIGGVRNWDYRYNWLRDAAFTVQALFKAGYEVEARAYTDWFIDRCREHDPDELKPMYELRGGPVPDERLLRHLPGYMDSSPVRVGNAAKNSFSSTSTARPSTRCTRCRATVGRSLQGTGSLSVRS
jgi:alpha,alpha-trehalase